MFVAIENVIDKAIDDRRFANGLITEEDDLVFKERRDCSFRQI